MDAGRVRVLRRKGAAQAPTRLITRCRKPTRPCRHRQPCVDYLGLVVAETAGSCSATLPTAIYHVLPRRSSHCVIRTKTDGGFDAVDSASYSAPSSFIELLSVSWPGSSDVGSATSPTTSVPCVVSATRVDLARGDALDTGTARREMPARYRCRRL